MSVDRTVIRLPVKTIPHSPDNRGRVDNDPDRPGPIVVEVKNPGAKAIVGSFVEMPVTREFTGRGGKQMGGGWSEKSRARARRRAAANGL